MASLAILASLGSVHIDDNWTRGYSMTWHMANPWQCARLAFPQTSTLAYDVPALGYVVIRLDPPSPEKTPSPGDRRLSTYSFDQTIWALYRTGSGNVGLTHSLMKHPVRSGNQPLPDEASRANRPSAGTAPRSVPTQQTVCVVAPTLQLLTISLAKPFLSNTT